MPNLDDFISYSSYTTKIYMKNIDGSFRNTRLNFSIFGVQGSPVIFPKVEIFFLFLFCRYDHMKIRKIELVP